jgi:hypothetical protein
MHAQPALLRKYYDIPGADDPLIFADIIGSGASGAAVAWRLAETRVRIVYVEQGDWIEHADFSSGGHD